MGTKLVLELKKQLKNSVPADIHWGSMIMSAFRYALGRQTGVVSETCDYVRGNLSKLQNKWVIMIRREIVQYFDDIERGLKTAMCCDKDQWRALKKDLDAEIYSRLQRGEMGENEVA